MLNQQQLRAASTFFDSNNKHNTWIHPATKEKYQFDHLKIKKHHLKYVTNVKMKSDGIPSDHKAIMINMKFSNDKWIPKKKRDITAKPLIM